ncbi:MAG: hypothetical protein KME13_22445 [Myxacorys californica WJT36-NPBG1]|nr:hypothetical protein [Myxacorys californica WJT36-NPBG1]
MQTNFSTVQQKLYRLLWLAPDILLRLPYARITSLLVNRVIAQLESLNGGEQS